MLGTVLPLLSHTVSPHNLTVVTHLVSRTELQETQSFTDEGFRSGGDGPVGKVFATQAQQPRKVSVSYLALGE